MTAPFIVRDATQRSTQWLQSRGIPTARLDAELLLAHVLSCTRLDLFMHPDRPLNEAERDAYRALIVRRSAHEPVAYILGTVGFWKHDFIIDARGLIPRPETEGILDAVLREAGTTREAPLRIIDVGCGSGVLAVSLALEFPNAQVVAIDISEDALSLTAENADHLGVRDRVHPLRSDLLERMIQRGSKADIIVSNPPYIAESERHLMSEGVERWEPTGALFAADNGFALIDRLLSELPEVLAPGGLFVMEFGSPQSAGIRARAERRFRRWEILKDYSQHDRLLMVHAPGTRPWALSKDDASSSAELGSEGDAKLPEEAHFEDEDGHSSDPDFAKQSLLYGGADGRELLPEINLHDDVEKD